MTPEFSICLCCHNELSYIGPLLDRLHKFIIDDRSATYEVVILDDSDDPKTIDLLDSYNKLGYIQLYRSHTLAGDYAAHKNHLLELCKGKWLLNLDMDELVSEDFLAAIPHIIDQNPTVDAYFVSRINIVDGLTLARVREWGWILSKIDEFTSIKAIDSSSEEYALLKAYNYIISEENGIVTYYEPIIQFPDHQMRLFRNDPKIFWKNKVHEVLTGFSNYSILPQESEYAILHRKTLTRQIAQNDKYRAMG